MTTYDMLRCYLEGLLAPLLRVEAPPDAGTLADDRGATIGEYIVITLASLAGAAIVGGIIWAALQSGAESVQVNAP